MTEFDRIEDDLGTERDAHDWVDIVAVPSMLRGFGQLLRSHAEFQRRYPEDE